MRFGRCLCCGRINSPSIAALTIISIAFQLAAAAQAEAHRWKWQNFQYRDGVQARVDAPILSGATRSITFIDGNQYWPGTDDDFNYAITPIDGWNYRVTTSGGNQASSIGFRVSTWELPDYVGWERRILNLTGKRSTDATVFNVSPGNDAIVIIEVLAYWPGGDDDFAYAARASGHGDAISVTAICDFGRDESSSVTFRATLLYWETGRPVHWAINRLIGTEETSQHWDTPCDDRALLATPTIYMTDITKYTDFDNLPGQLAAHSLAGKSFSAFGAVVDAASLAKSGYGASAGDPVSIGSFAFDLGKQMKKYIGLAGPDDRDDDFYLLSLVDGCRLTARIGDGNGYSLGEVTGWAIDFP